MHLLTVDDDGTFRLETFTEPNIPPYAILSHTWGNDTEEVTFQDILDGAGNNKAGYQKLRFCGNQAKADSLSYFWVDTCCIDKSNEKELTTAINSMFRWYKNAARCYVYLTDVSIRTQDGLALHMEWDSSFRNSRWFTRGWTLQELLAPKIVEFYSRDLVRLGDRTSLERQIHGITDITVEALRGRGLQDFSIQERFQWGEKRQTTIGEDMAYCLLGIFDVFLPLIHGEGRTSAMRRLRREVEDRASEKYNSRTLDKTPLSVIPFERNPFFTSRGSELSKLEGLLFQTDQYTKIAITGLGGVGKTQIAIELLHRTMEKHRNCLVLWIPATDPETLLQAYMAVARQLNIPRRDEKGADIMRLVQNYLSDENTGRWLLVFDNADDMDMWSKPVSEQTSNRLLDYLPKSKHGKIVFTTRDRKVAVKLAPRNIVEVREMNSDAATELLQKYLVEYDLAANSDATKALLAELTYLPLAIIQASAYIKANGVSIADYLSLLAEQDESTIELLSEDFEDDGRYENIKNPVATTWLISFERIQQRDPLAADYLSFMACIEPKEIPRTLLPEGPSRKKEMDALGTLDAYSFITRREAGVDQVFDLHHLVHLATRNWITEKGLIRQWVMRTIQRLNKVLPDNDDSRHTNITSWRKYLPHARCALLSDEIDRTGTDYTDLAWNLGSCLHSDGRYKEAELLFSEVTKRNRMVLGEEHLITLRSTADLATIFCKMGRLKEAEELEVKIKDTRIRVLGEEHPETLRSMANLAATYTYQGQWKEAEDLEVHVIDIRKRVLGEEHPNTLYTMANLTTTYMNQGRWREAHELGMQVRDATMRVLGEENLWTLRSLANLAATYRNQDQWKEAEKLEVQVMETRKRTLGEEHPDTLHGMNFLIRTYLGQEKLNEAEELSVQVMDATKRVLGEEHPDTQHAIENQAFLRKRQGQDTEAINLLANCVALRTRVLGADHRYTLYSVRSLAEWQAERLDEIIRSKGRS